MADLQAQLWSNQQPWPELELPEVAEKAPLGICFSGGGSRALSAAWGQLRALHHLNLLPRVRWISGVSGGSWASGIFTFQRVTDEGSFLGPLTEPSNLSLKGEQRALTPTELGFAATRDIWSFLIEAARDPQLPLDRLWADVIGRHMLAPFGLYEHNKDEAVFASEAHARAALQRPGNEDVMRTWIRRWPARGPYLVVGACVLGPEELVPLAGERPVPIDFTPYYSGIRERVTGVFKQKLGPLGKLAETLSGGDRQGTVHAVPLGGCVMETFGFDGNSARFEGGVQSLPAPARPWSFANIVGTSSSAWAGELEELLGLGDLYKFAPMATLWPARRMATPPSTSMALGDGGILENFGLLTLLRRGVERAVVFVNTQTPLATDWDPYTEEASADRVDGYLPGLFGRPQTQVGTTTVDNMVFDTSEMAPLIAELQAARKAGRPVMALHKHIVLPNPWWGIKGDREVNILWVYLDHIPAWANQIDDSALRDAIREGNRRVLPSGPLKNFPHYKTEFEDLGRPISLTDVQARTLADMTAWGLVEGRALLERLILG